MAKITLTTQPGEDYKFEFQKSISSVGVPADVAPIDFGNVIKKYEEIEATTLFNDHQSKNVSIAADKEIGTMLSSHPIDIVISIEALKTIANNYPPIFEEEWTLPVHVVTQPQGKRRFVAYVDAPLLPQTLTPREIQQEFYNTTISTLLSFGRGNKMPSELHAKYDLWRASSPTGYANVLIRTRHDCTIRGQPKHAFVKLEYRSDLGLEEQTTFELGERWISAYLEKTASVGGLFVRLSAHEGTVVSVDVTEDESEVLAYNTQFRDMRMIKAISAVLTQVKLSSPGVYLLHKPSKKDTVTLYKSIIEQKTHKQSTDTSALTLSIDDEIDDEGSKEDEEMPDVQDDSGDASNTFDLHAYQRDLPTVDKVTLPYVPLQWRSRRNAIPHTFIPQPQGNNANFTYCYDFAHQGVCKKVECKYIHLLKREVFEIQKARGGVPQRHSKRSGNKNRRNSARGDSRDTRNAGHKQ